MTTITDSDPHKDAAHELAGVSFKFLGEARKDLPRSAKEAHRILSEHLSAAALATNEVDKDHAGIGDRPPSDRRWAKDRAASNAIDHRRKVTDALEAAESATVVLDAELMTAAIPPVPKDAADAKDELRMMLTSKAAKADLLALAREDRYAGLLAGSWGKAYLRSIGQGDLHDTIRRAIAGKAAPQSVAAKKAVVAARAAMSHRLRRHGLDGL